VDKTCQWILKYEVVAECSAVLQLNAVKRIGSKCETVTTNGSRQRKVYQRNRTRIDAWCLEPHRCVNIGDLSNPWL